MSINVPRNGRLQSAIIPAVLLCTWLAAVALLLGGLVDSERDRLERNFDRAFEDLAQQVRGQLLQNDLALAAFRGFLTAKPEVDFERTRMFARLLLSQYPNIYMFEIAQRIPRDERNALEERMHAAGYHDFVIHEFGYDSDRQIRPSGDRPLYQPIIFLEPELPEVKNVLGLDLSSTSGILGEASRMAYGELEDVSSLPFELLEGGRGYVIYGPVLTEQKLPERELRLKSGLFALVVVKASSLLPRSVREWPGWTVRLQRTAAPSAEEGIVSSASNPRSGALGLDLLLEPLQRRALLKSRSQPFALAAEFKVGWKDIDVSSFVRFFVATVMTLVLTLLASFAIYRRRLVVNTRRKALYARANFDLTTALPNKYLLQDRIDQAIKHARRNGTSIGLIFADLDRFKAVNDRWGHAVGDEVLKEVGQRISETLREEDAVGRIHGDEFVVLLPDVQDTETVDTVAEKLRHVLDRPLEVSGIRIELGMSVGVAIFPQDGDDFDSLLRVSDKRMYAAKRA